MGWQAVFENLSTYSSETHSAGDLPLDGLQAVVVNGIVYTGLDCCGWGQVDGKDAVLVPEPRTRYAEMKSQYPEAVIVRSKTTSTKQFHKVEVLTGIWSELNKVPSANWEKDLIGWRVWTETDVFDSAKVPEHKWLDLWGSLPPGGWQGLVLYENWKTGGGDDYRQNFGGGDHYVMAPSPYGPVFLNNNDTKEEIEQRYPGASVKVGTQLPDEAFAPIQAAIINSVTLL